MEKFGHFFEFIAAVNSAYIVSDYFIESLLEKVNSHFKLLKFQFEGIRKNQTNNKEKLFEEKKTGSINVNIEPVNDLVKKGSDIESEIVLFEVHLMEAFQNKQIFNNFHYWCLFGCLYSILIMLMNGFEFNMDSILNNIIFIGVSFIAAITLLLLIKDKKKKFFKEYFYPSFNKTISCFLLPLIIFIVLVNYKIKDFRFFDFSLYFIKNCSIILAILLSTGHFIIYYIKSFLRSQRESNILTTELELIEGKCEKFGQEIETIFNVLNAIEVKKQGTLVIT